MNDIYLCVIQKILFANIILKTYISHTSFHNDFSIEKIFPTISSNGKNRNYGEIKIQK